MLQAMVLAFAADHSIPFSTLPKLIEMTKVLSSDRTALSEVKLSRQAAGYKIRFGVGEAVMHDIVEKLKTCPFSLNCDEAFSNKNTKVLAMLVCFYDPDLGRVVCEHLRSAELVTVNSESIFTLIKDTFAMYDIPWENLVSVLMDSCATMRGSKTGVEVRLKEMAPHLLDIDGDISHTINNAAKKFTKPFGNYLEQLFGDLHRDCKYSTDIRDALRQICELMGISFAMPERFTSHRLVF